MIPSYGLETCTRCSTFQVVRDLSSSPVGTVEIVRGHDFRFGEDFEVPAFLPSPLPRVVDLSPACWRGIADAQEALGRLDASTALIKNPQLLTRLATRREAVGTSAIEGTFANLTDVYAADAMDLDSPQDLPPNLREIRNYMRVAEEAYRWVVDRPITLGLLKALQSDLVEGTPAAATDRGAIRTQQVYIGVSNRPISEARYVPPPEGDRLSVMMEDWVEWVNEPARRPDVPLLAVLPMAHYQFESIHPFHDGNGRLGRLVMILQLLRANVLRSPSLSLSPWLREHEQEYRDMLLETSATGDWNALVTFFSRAIAEQSRDTTRRVVQLLELRERLSDDVRTALPKARLALEIAENLIANPIVSAASATQIHGRSNQANRDAIHKLVDLGLLAPFNDDTYGRLFWNAEVFRIIS